MLAGKRVEMLPAVHTVPAVGYAVTTGQGYWVFTGDTERNPALWTRLNQMDVAMLVIETAFSNCQEKLAKRSLHLCPESLVAELGCIASGKNYPIYITHTKPAETQRIMDEIQQQVPVSPAATRAVNAIQWLSAGQEFEF